MTAPVRYLLIAVAAAVAVALGLYAYQTSQHKVATPLNDRLAQAREACLNNLKVADKADAGAGAKATEAGADVTASVGTTRSEEHGADRNLPPNLQMAEQDKIRECNRLYLPPPKGPTGELKAQ